MALRAGVEMSGTVKGAHPGPRSLLGQQTGNSRDVPAPRPRLRRLLLLPALCPPPRPQPAERPVGFIWGRARRLGPRSAEAGVGSQGTCEGKTGPRTAPVFASEMPKQLFSVELRLPCCGLGIGGCGQRRGSRRSRGGGWLCGAWVPASVLCPLAPRFGSGRNRGRLRCGSWLALSPGQRSSHPGHHGEVLLSAHVGKGVPRLVPVSGRSSLEPTSTPPTYNLRPAITPRPDFEDQPPAPTNYPPQGGQQLGGRRELLRAPEA